MIRAYEPERKGGQIIIPEGVQNRLAMVDNRAVVIEVGPAAWKDEGFWKTYFWGFFRRWIQVDRAKAGDRVLVTKFAGFMAQGPADGQQYRIINDRDVFCGITHEELA